jgi:hypothetical protein
LIFHRKTDIFIGKNGHFFRKKRIQKALPFGEGVKAICLDG